MLTLHPFSKVPQQFAQRALAPTLAHLAGHHAIFAFRWLSYLSIMGTGLLTDVIAARFGVRLRTRLVMILGLLATYDIADLAFNPYLSDQLGLLLVTASICALVCRWRGLTLIAAVGVLQRQVALGLFLPVFLWLRMTQTRRVALRAAAILLLVSIVTFAVVVALVPTVPHPSFLNTLRTQIRLSYDSNLRTAAPFWISATFVLSGGLWWALSLSGLRRPGFGRLAIWLVPVFLQCVIAADWWRYAIYALPVIFPAGALLLDRHPWRRPLVGLVALQVASLPLLRMSPIAKVPVPEPYFLVVLGLTLATVGLLLLHWARDRFHGRRPLRRLPSG